MKRVVLVATVAVVLAVKLYYRHATAADLDWILLPTVRLVELLTGLPFVKEAGIGYFNRDAAFAVIPACAGVNFLVVAFASLVLGQLSRVKQPLWLFFGAALPAFCATLVANAVRLAIAVELHRENLGWGWLTPGRLHQLEGVVVYLTALLLLSLGAAQLLPKEPACAR
jgi:exosortase K